MLIHAAYAEGRWPDARGLRFSFEEESLAGRIGALARRFAQNRKKNGTDAPAFIDVARRDRIFVHVSPAGAASVCFRTDPGAGPFVSVIVGAPGRLARRRQAPLAIGAPDGRRPVSGRYIDLAVGDLHFLCIPPENLTARSLREDLNALLRRTTIHLALIDNAHILSEWSQAFRPSARRITSLLEYLAVQSPDLSVIALSHSASPPVRQDILDTLDLKDATPAAPKTWYRNNIRFQVHAAASPEQKARMRREIMAGDAAPPPSFPVFDPPTPFPDADLSVRFSMRTRPGAAVRPGPRVWMTDDMDGRLDDFLFSALYAADRNERVRSVLLVEPPDGACDADMRQRLSWFPQCVSGQCAFGKKDLCDFGRRHRAVRCLRPDVETAVTRTLAALDALVAGHEAGESPLRIPLVQNDREGVELALYRLTLIGVVELYFIDEHEDPPAFKVYGFNSRLNKEAALAGIYAYLQKHEAPSARTVSASDIARFVRKSRTIDACRVRWGREIDGCIAAAVEAGRLRHFEDYGAYYRDVIDHLLPFITRVADDLKEMAARALWRLREFVRGGACRYAALLQGVREVDDAWTCGSCDWCAPEAAAATPGVLKEPLPPDDLEDRLAEWLGAGETAGDWDRAGEFIRAGEDRRRSLLRRACHAAERGPNNIRALYMIAALSGGAFKGRHYLALIRAAGRKLTPGQICRMYETLDADADIRKMMFDLLDDEYGPLNLRDGEEWLYREAGRLSLDDQTLDFLGARLVLDKIARTDLKPVKTAVTQLIEEM